MGQAAEVPRDRLQALDVLRGVAVAGMILVNSPGSWELAYAPLKHAHWHGWTLADMVFPTFLFGVGVAWGLGFPKSGGASPWPRILRRTALLFLLGLLLNAPSAPDLAHLRIPGVLQRIALCYLVVAIITLVTARRDPDGRLQLNRGAVAIATLAVLAGYWALLMLVPVPGHGAGNLDSAYSLPAWIDRAVFGTGHLWAYATTEGLGVTFDPEGLVSTLGAVANTLIGVLAAAIYRAAPRERRVRMLALGALALVAAGLLLDRLLPINKSIWTSSFALFSSGFSLALLAALMLLPAGGAADAVRYPFRLLGGNAILAYTLSQLLGTLGGLPIGGTTPQGWGFATASAMLPDPYLASLACALAILALITLVLVPLERRGIYLRL